MASISSSARVSSGSAGGERILTAGPITRINTIGGWAAFLVVALAPIPLGSNRPFFWALWAALIGGASLFHVLGVKAARQEFRVPWSAIQGIAVAFLVVALFMVVQILPIGGFVPIEFTNQFGDVFASRTLSAAPGETALALLRWGTYGGVFFLLVQAGVQEKRNRLFLRGLLLVVVCEAAYALVALTQLGDTILFFDKRSYLGAATGTFVNRNTLATFLGLGIVLATALATRRSETSAKRRGGPRSPGNVDMWRLFLLLASIFIMSAALVATQSRMGLFSTAGGVLCVLALRRPGGTLFTVGIGAAGMAAIAFLYGSGVAERFMMTDQSGESRATLYHQVFGMILQRPLLGYGAGSFALAFPLSHEPSLPVSVTWDHAHSTYLALWSGLGLVAGTIPMLIVAAIVLRVARRTSRRTRPSVESTVAIGATVTVALHSLIDFSLEIQAVALLYVALLALGSARIFNSSPGHRQ